MDERELNNIHFIITIWTYISIMHLSQPGCVCRDTLWETCDHHVAFVFSPYYLLHPFLVFSASYSDNVCHITVITHNSNWFFQSEQCHWRLCKQSIQVLKRRTGNKAYPLNCKMLTDTLRHHQANCPLLPLPSCKWLYEIVLRRMP